MAVTFNYVKKGHFKNSSSNNNDYNEIIFIGKVIFLLTKSAQGELCCVYVVVS